MEVPPYFCWHEHVNEVMAFARRLFIMAPLHPISHSNAFAQHDQLIFFYVKNHRNPVSHKIWDYLSHLDRNKVTVVAIGEDP